MFLVKREFRVDFFFTRLVSVGSIHEETYDDPNLLRVNKFHFILVPGSFAGSQRFDEYRESAEIFQTKPQNSSINITHVI